MRRIDLVTKLSDKELIDSLKDLVAEEREVQTTILHYIREVEERKLYLQFGYGSLFSYLIEGLGYAEASAYRRIQSGVTPPKTLWSHQNPEGNMEKLLEKLMDAALEKGDPSPKQSKKPSQLPAPESDCTYGRYIPKSLRIQVWQRDQGRCQYQDPRTGKKCHSNHLIEIDHRYPLALGGENSPSNLRLLCRNHNQYRQERLKAMNC